MRPARQPERKAARKSAGGAKPRRRSPCPVACTLDVLGDKWTLLVIRDLFAGKSRFHEFARSPERIATNILTERLARLVSSGLVTASPAPQREGAMEYRLTARGQALFPVLVAVRDWGLANLPGTLAHIRVPEGT